MEGQILRSPDPRKFLRKPDSLGDQTGFVIPMKFLRRPDALQEVVEDHQTDESKTMHTDVGIVQRVGMPNKVFWKLTGFVIPRIY